MADASASANLIVRFFPGGDLFALAGWLLSGALAFIALIWGVCWGILSHKFKYDQACKDVDSLSTRIDNSLLTIIDMLSANILVEKKGAKSQSPITYTSYGKKLIEEATFPQIFEEKKSMFIDLLTQRTLSDEASFDQACWEVMLLLEDEEITEKLRKTAYENGLPEPALRKLCAIYLREELKREIFPSES